MYARTLKIDELKAAQQRVIIILCKLELIFPHALFDIMVHLVMHLPNKAIEGWPVHSGWMYPFERYIEKLKQYVRNQARLEGSIAKGYVMNEALTFRSMYFQDMEMQLNRLERHMATMKSTM